MMPIIVSRETIVTALLVYIMIGSLVWLFLVHVGVVATGFERVRARQRGVISTWFAVKTTVVSIVVWPLFVAITFKRRKEAWAKLRKVVWR